MCGRYTNTLKREDLARIFPEAAHLADATGCERFNIAPTQDVLALVERKGERRMGPLRWGLVPFWAKDPSVGNRMINARAETAATKPAFRDAMRRRRCLIPADGFYEWRKLADAAPDSDAPAKGKRKPAVRKQPYLFRMKGDKPFAFGGLWDTWWRDGKKLESFTILTTTPNELVAPVHDRMPVIVARADFARWLDSARNATDVQDLLRPYDAAEMEAVPVGKHVNSPGNDDPRCVEKEDAWE